MGETTRSLRKGCAFGCGGLLLLCVLGPGVVGVRTCAPLRAADRDLARLEARFGPAESFEPAADGAIPAARLRAFLEVRRRSEASCRELGSMSAEVLRVDALDEDEPASGAEVAGATRALAGVAVEIAPAVGRFFERRNAAPLEAEIDALAHTSERLPWREALPAGTERSLAERREELDRAFCPGTAGIATDRKPTRALRLALE